MPYYFLGFYNALCKWGRGSRVLPRGRKFTKILLDKDRINQEPCTLLNLLHGGLAFNETKIERVRFPGQGRVSGRPRRWGEGPDERVRWGNCQQSAGNWSRAHKQLAAYSIRSLSSPATHHHSLVPPSLFILPMSVADPLFLLIRIKILMRIRIHALIELPQPKLKRNIVKYIIF